MSGDIIELFGFVEARCPEQWATLYIDDRPSGFRPGAEHFPAAIGRKLMLSTSLCRAVLFGQGNTFCWYRSVIGHEVEVPGPFRLGVVVDDPSRVEDASEALATETLRQFVRAAHEYDERGEDPWIAEVARRADSGRAAWVNELTKETLAGVDRDALRSRHPDPSAELRRLFMIPLDYLLKGHYRGALAWILGHRLHSVSHEAIETELIQLKTVLISDH